MEKQKIKCAIDLYKNLNNNLNSETLKSSKFYILLI